MVEGAATTQATTLDSDKRPPAKHSDCQPHALPKDRPDTNTAVASKPPAAPGAEARQEYDTAQIQTRHDCVMQHEKATQRYASMSISTLCLDVP